MPSWHTGRLRIMRLGCCKLTGEKEKADDRIRIADHTVRRGREKCLAISGLRQSALPKADTILCPEDAEPITLLPVTTSDGEIVYQQPEDTVSKTGVPREIISDHGPDVKSGMGKFCDAHPETCFIYDIKHKAATILKRELSSDEQRVAFVRPAAETGKKVRQTELAAFAPPNQKTKARYMNVSELVKWSADRIILLKDKEIGAKSEYDPARLKDQAGLVVRL